MKEFPLKIVTPDGVAFDAMAQSLVVRTIDGEVGILAGHQDFSTALGMGRAKVVCADGTKYAACIGGMLLVCRGSVTLVPTTFEWAQDIDASSTKRSQQRAEDILRQNAQDQLQIQLAQARLKRALIRQNVAGYK